MSRMYGTGCLKSHLDGTERVFKASKLDKIPTEYSYIGMMPPVLDQGKTSMCVCYSVTSFLDWYVNQDEGTNESNGFDIKKLYSIRSNSGEGMEIKEALHYLRHKGLNGVKIAEYAMVKSDLALQQALIANGPCILGLPVYDNDSDAFWQRRGSYAGGHAILCVGYDKDGFILRNSWGKSWAQKGYIRWPYEDFGAMFEAWTIL